MNVLDLFSGIGLFSLGLERAGMRTVAFCEQGKYQRSILGKHWPGVPIYDDVQTLTAGRLAADGISVDAICGGFPCQDISTIGRGAGIEGERSGLWAHYARLIGELRPSYVIVENVAALLGRGLDRVLGDLAALRYDAEWYCIPAAAVGAPHRRDRIWIVAYPDSISGRPGARGQDRPQANHGGEVPYPAHYAAIREGIRRGDAAGQWWTEPSLGRVAHGVPNRVDRLACLGNAVVPQIPQIIGEAIMQKQKSTWEFSTREGDGGTVEHWLREITADKRTIDHGPFPSRAAAEAFKQTRQQ